MLRFCSCQGTYPQGRDGKRHDIDEERYNRRARPPLSTDSRWARASLHQPCRKRFGASFRHISVIIRNCTVKEISFALIIALVIIIGIEHESRQHDINNSDAMRKLIASDVFRGVFSRRLNKAYVDKVIDEHLQPRLIRPETTVSWTLKPHTASPSDPTGVSGSDLVELHSTFEFTLENVTGSSYVDCIPFVMPAGTPFNHLSSVQINGKYLTNEEIEKCRDTDRRDSIYYNFPVSIPKESSVSVRLTSATLKDISGNEVWGTYHPTLSSDFTVTCNLPNVSLASLHALLPLLSW